VAIADRIGVALQELKAQLEARPDLGPEIAAAEAAPGSPTTVQIAGAELRPVKPTGVGRQTTTQLK
jgi:hypothetical protein